MEGDGFSDPRRRAARRPRGGIRGRGRGQQHSRGSQKRVSTKPRLTPNLGSNEYRFRPVEEGEEENVYDAGVDFQEAASQQIYDPTSNEDLQHSVNLSDELSADFSKLESVLASVPLWVRLGEHTRFALGVPDEDHIENYLDPLVFPSEDIACELDTSNKEPNDEFLRDLASISFDDDATTGEVYSNIEVNSPSKAHAKKEKVCTTGASTTEKAKKVIPSSQREESAESDDLDDWLDEM